jgi:hypothetical protein
MRASIDLTTRNTFFEDLDAGDAGTSPVRQGKQPHGDCGGNFDGGGGFPAGDAETSSDGPGNFVLPAVGSLFDNDIVGESSNKGVEVFILYRREKYPGYFFGSSHGRG